MSVLIPIAGRTNIADILTKAQATAVFTELMAAYHAFVAGDAS